jgi:predicted DsbA family dithiol-disulfide isomerase
VSTLSSDAMPSVVIYGDFNCPFSALANARANRLAAVGRLKVDWCTVEHDTKIGPHETPLTSEQAAALRAELDQIAEILTPDEPDRFRVPSRRLNTRDLNLIYAATPHAHRAALRTAFFDAYWVHDRDLTSDCVIDEIVDTIVRSSRHDDVSDDQAKRSIATWQRQWAELPRPIVPTMILDHAYVSRGLGALARLASGSVSAPSPRRTAGDQPKQIHTPTSD